MGREIGPWDSGVNIAIHYSVKVVALLTVSTSRHMRSAWYR